MERESLRKLGKYGEYDEKLIFLVFSDLLAFLNFNHAKVQLNTPSRGFVVELLIG